METLINITTGGQGSPVVSARELHGFFEVKTEFAKWSKRMFDYGFTEEIDYEQVFVKNDENPAGGRPQIDYALTLDCAKEIAMLQRSEKGKQARQYFIQAEKALRTMVDELPAPAQTQLTTEQLLVQLLTNQQQQLEQLRADVETIRQTGHKLPPTRPGKQLALPGLPGQRQARAGLRQAVTSRVAEYCRMSGATTQETWTYLYRRLQQVNGIDVHRLMRKPGESMLDSLERYGYLDRLDNLVRAELDYREGE